MGFFLKVFSAILSCILPKKTFNQLIYKAKETKKILNKTPQTRLLIFVLTYPIVIVFDLLAGFIKLLMLWFLPDYLYSGLHFIFKLFIRDITIDHRPFKLAFKRSLLCLELFTKGAEKTKSFGDKNPDKTFYVLRPYYYLTRNALTENVSNLLMHYYRNLQNLAYAIENGWIPVVDWQNYGPFPHGEDYPINGTTNCWEYYWNQPSEYTLEEVYQSKNVILSVQNTRDNKYVPSCSFQSPLQVYAEKLATDCPKYDSTITFNKYTEEYIDGKQAELFPKGKRILGVSVRGTSYGVCTTTNNVNGHPIQPELSELIKSIRKRMQEWDMDYVFITCELESIILQIKDVLGDCVIFLPRTRYQKPPMRGDVEKKLDPLYLPGKKYQSNLDYLTEMVLLSRCNSLLAAMSSGVRAAIIWNRNQYENMAIFDKGIW